MTSRSAGSASYKRIVVTAVPSGCGSQMKYGRWSTGIEIREFAICVAKYEPLTKYEPTKYEPMIFYSIHMAKWDDAMANFYSHLIENA